MAPVADETQEFIHTNVILKVPNEDLSTNVTILELSRLNLLDLNEAIKFPVNLKILNLSHNLLTEVPDKITNLEFLTELDLSFNRIGNFDMTPKFFNQIERLDLSRNCLVTPPLWIWFGRPRRLQDLNLSDNGSMVTRIMPELKKSLLECKLSVKIIKMCNCKLQNFKILDTLYDVEELALGRSVPRLTLANQFYEFPSTHLPNIQKNLQKLFLPNMKIFEISPCINKCKLLKEIDLSMNNISILPDEFCKLIHLEICTLSCNNLIYLPCNWSKMQKLKKLVVDHNVISLLPDNLFNLVNLKHVDVYNNCLEELPGNYLNIEEIDFAQNCFDEPEEEMYVEKRKKLRNASYCSERINGKKEEVMYVEYDSRSHSSCSSSVYDEHAPNITTANGQATLDSDSEEDWDSFWYWKPNVHVKCNMSAIEDRTWNMYLKNKFSAGIFCPIHRNFSYDVQYNTQNERSLQETYLILPDENYMQF